MSTGLGLPQGEGGPGVEGVHACMCGCEACVLVRASVCACMRACLCVRLRVSVWGGLLLRALSPCATITDGSMALSPCATLRIVALHAYRHTRVAAAPTANAACTRACPPSPPSSGTTPP